MLDMNSIERHLNTSFIGRYMEYHESIASTNSRAKDLAHQKQEGTVIIAEEQTQGKGRLSRKWLSPKGKGLWFSILLKPDLEADKVYKTTLIGAAAVNEALKDMGIKSYIKWPNDIIVEGKKVCGILTEMSWGRDRVNYVVMGIGINVNLEAEDFDDEIREKATSLKIVTGKEIERNRLLASILNQVEKLYTPFKERGDLKETIQICRRESILIGKDVRLIRGDSEEIGKVLDIDEQGQLVVEYADGKIEKVLSGEVSIRGREGYI
ncbi:MAG: biotin--[acetyl-CoA-carboxylase] ligase [Tissierellia bacterium]|nr:biotin--[acetyl-CoA-carboxylase] ligase [Tissierellia bacterium]